MVKRKKKGTPKPNKIKIIVLSLFLVVSIFPLIFGFAIFKLLGFIGFILCALELGREWAKGKEDPFDDEYY